MTPEPQRIQHSAQDCRRIEEIAHSMLIDLLVENGYTTEQAEEVTDPTMRVFAIGLAFED